MEIFHAYKSLNPFSQFLRILKKIATGACPCYLKMQHLPSFSRKVSNADILPGKEEKNTIKRRTRFWNHHYNNRMILKRLKRGMKLTNKFF